MDSGGSDLDNNVKDASSVVIEPAQGESRKTSLWRRVVGLVWDSVEGDPEYRQYVQRLDTFFLYDISFCSRLSSFGPEAVARLGLTSIL